MPETTLRPLTDDEHPLVENLWQLYRHDLSEFRGTLPDELGRFAPGHLPLHLTGDPDRTAYLVRLDGRPAGFVLLRGLVERPLRIAEFFVARAARRQGVGRVAALRLLELHPGDWEIAFQEENPSAARFWRRLAAEVAGDRWTEERRPVPGKPHLPPDVWLVLSV
ncbi:MAG: GNAT family N-acetyltransferase [Nocardioidaceae bacterium]|nr:GNAT family N-acetyltransferase [Nocardioidaceae bacterium]NUS52309.1 GNAT family N-acetyltransferase [Nocardioidaceae bacterium]